MTQPLSDDEIQLNKLLKRKKKQFTEDEIELVKREGLRKIELGQKRIENLIESNKLLSSQPSDPRFEKPIEDEDLTYYFQENIVDGSNDPELLAFMNQFIQKENL